MEASQNRLETKFSVFFTSFQTHPCFSRDIGCALQETAGSSRADASFPSVRDSRDSTGGGMYSSRVGTGERASGSGTRRRPAAPPPYNEDDEGMAAIRGGATTRAGHSLRQKAPSASAAQQADGLPAVPFHPVLPPPHDTTAVSSSSSSRAAAAAAGAPPVAPAYTLPVRKSFRRPDEPVVVNQPAVYLFTDQYPFTAHQFDKENEVRLVCMHVCVSLLQA